MCPLCERLANPDPFRLARFEHSTVILGDNQGCPGWCTLILNDHHDHLDGLPLAAQAALFGEVARVARAVRTLFATDGEGGGPVRINYECLGNVASHVHWHVVPRHAADPTLRATVWGWNAEQLRGGMSLGEREVLAGKLRALLLKP